MSLAEAFGKGRDSAAFRIVGASEVRQAAAAFNQMRDRIRRQIAQRTEMLAGVSHDLRTPLTRFKLELALLEDGPELAGLKKDVDEMARMIELTRHYQQIANLLQSHGDMRRNSIDKLAEVPM